MAKRLTPARTTTCTLCAVTAHAIPSTTHRRSGGGPGQPVRAKHSGIGGKRGRWQ